MAELATVATLATLASSAMTAAGTIASGNAAEARGEAINRAAQFEAQQLKIQGKDDLAAASAEAKDLRRRKTLALSTLQARAAAGGFSATDPTALDLTEEIEKYGSLQEQMALYGGKTRKQQAGYGAAARRFEGDAAFKLGEAYQGASYLSAAGTILGGFSGMAAKYGGNKPAPAAPTSRFEELLYR